LQTDGYNLFNSQINGASDFMKINSRIYKGIHYVQFADLPALQQEKFTQTHSASMFIKILIDKRVVAKCIQYKDYELWFDSIYKKQAVHANTAESTSVSMSLSKVSG
jgi:hypothetical protein